MAKMGLLRLAVCLALAAQASGFLPALISHHAAHFPGRSSLLRTSTHPVRASNAMRPFRVGRSRAATVMQSVETQESVPEDYDPGSKAHECDVVVIGSGLGGLTAAALLVRTVLVRGS